MDQDQVIELESMEFEFVDLGDAKEETRFGYFRPPTDGVNVFRF